MKNVRNITVVGSISEVGNLISKLAVNEHIKDKSVGMRYMGGVAVASGIEAKIKFWSADVDKLDAVHEISQKGI